MTETIYTFGAVPEVWDILRSFDVECIDGDSVLTHDGVREVFFVEGGDISAARREIIARGLGDVPRLFAEEEIRERTETALRAVIR